MHKLAAEDHWRAVEAQARRHGFKSVAKYEEAEFAANRAYYDDDDMAALAVRYIRRDAAHRAAARAAATAPRRSKWADLQGDTMRLGAEIQAARPGLSRSRLADLVLDQLAADHDRVPGRSTMMDWLKKVDG
ncbi:hypothetical protein [Sedimentitalea sp.]|uniref:hypothetical protein n=1 Tax=Sedimentitalea sp. TaxID=2048915 RepID=UPI0032998B97